MSELRVLKSARSTAPLLSAGLLALSACNPASCFEFPSFELPDAGLPSLHGTEDPLQQELVVQGVVSVRAPTAGAVSQRASGATVRITADRDGNGTLSSGESVETTTDGDGRYRVEMSVTAGQTVVVSFHDDGAARLYRTLKAGPQANVRMNVTLEPLRPLACTGGRCAAEDGTLGIDNLGDGLRGHARAFNPVTETGAFPGAFDDSAGNLLLSGAFAAVELEDDAGNAVTTLSAPAQLRMRIPRDTWSIITDLAPGNGRVDVPMYAFDEVRGTWVREGEGLLEDDAGNVIAETALGSIRAGTFADGVHARATVNHFSYWNVDWPVDTRGCVRGIILDRDGNPAEGATVFASGVTYAGSSPGVTTGADGAFCVEVMRSEGASEDVDQDGINGETQRVRVRATHRGLAYDLGTVDVPVANGTCAGAGCADMGTLRLSPDNELIPTGCSVSGTVRDLAGNGVEGATVFAMDPSMDPELWVSACVSDPTACQFNVVSGAGGSYAMRIFVTDEIMVFANLATGSNPSTQRFGMASGPGCPAGPLDVVLDSGLETYTLTVTLNGNTITWEPALRAAYLSVDRGGMALWSVAGEDQGFLPPVTYGTAPAGGVAVGSADGGVPALQAGDMVRVMLGGVSASGYPYSGNGEATVP